MSGVTRCRAAGREPFVRGKGAATMSLRVGELTFLQQLARRFNLPVAECRFLGREKDQS